jgi:hypothetical protein
MDRNQMYGGIICLGAVLAGILFVIGVFSGSYLALAIPVTVITMGVLGLIAWVGWTIFSIKVEPPADDLAETETKEVREPAEEVEKAD